MKKIGRNDKCYCQSGKKFKLCCQPKENMMKQNIDAKYENGQQESSDNVQKIIKFLNNKYQDHKVIDITDDLNENTYKPYQIKNYKNKIIMVAERKLHNELVFGTRVNSTENIIIMYRGSYRTIRAENILQSFESINKMILTRLEGKDDV